MNRNGQSTMEFLLAFACICSIICLYTGCLESFNEKAGSSLDLQSAKAVAMHCALAVDSLYSNYAFSFPQELSCVSDSNFAVSSEFNSRQASVSIIPKARISSIGGRISLEVEGIGHYS